MSLKGYGNEFEFSYEVQWNCFWTLPKLKIKLNWWNEIKKENNYYHTGFALVPISYVLPWPHQNSNLGMSQLSILSHRSGGRGFSLETPSLSKPRHFKRDECKSVSVTITIYNFHSNIFPHQLMPTYFNPNAHQFIKIN